MIMNTLETGYKTPFCSREKLSYILFVLICDPYTLETGYNKAGYKTNFRQEKNHEVNFCRLFFMGCLSHRAGIMKNSTVIISPIGQA